MKIIAKMKYKFIFLLIISFIFTNSPYLKAQFVQNKYGKNRVQYKKFDWKYISSQNFEIYFYEGGYQTAQLTAEYAEADFPTIIDLIGFSPYSKIQVFVYNSITDLQQSNIGVNDQDFAIGGQTDFIKSEIEVAFSGTKGQYRKELKREISEILISEMMYGGNWRDVLQNSYLLNLPEWFMAGAATYASEGWSAEMDNFMRDVLLNRKVKKFDALKGKDATFIGQSIWNFIAEEYGVANIAGILNLTRIIKNEESSIQNTLGLSYGQFLGNWKNFYLNQYQTHLEKYDLPHDKNRIKKNDKNYIYNAIKISPDEKFIAYSENYKGAYNLKIKSLKNGKERKVLKGGYKIINQDIDYRIPIFQWKNNQELLVINAINGKHFLRTYNLKTRKKTRKLIGNFAHILSFDVSDDGTQLILSAEKNGQSDLYQYDLESGRLQQVTNDFSDELTPTFLKNSTKIIFASDRTTQAKDIHLARWFNLFIFDPETEEIRRLTNTLSNDTEPISITANELIFKSDIQGVTHLFRYDFGKKLTTQISRYRQSIKTFDWVKNRPVYVLFYRGREHIFYDAPYDFNEAKFTPQTLQKKLTDRRLLAKYPKKITSNSIDTSENDIQKPHRTVIKNGYKYEIIERELLLEPQKIGLHLKKPKLYQSRFGIDNIIWSINIDPLRNLGLVFEAGMTDVLENHKLNVGIFNLLNLRNNSYFIEYEYLKNRLDYRLRLDRVTLTQGNTPNYFFTHHYALNKVQGAVSVPLNITSRFTVSPFLASTSFNPSSSIDPQVQSIPSTDVYYMGFNVKFVYDNSLVTGVNMSDGLKIRINYENYIGLSNREKSFGNINIDARYYKKIGRALTFASRMAYGRFLGRAKKNFRLGGVANWAFYETDIPKGDPYEIDPNTPEQDYSDLLFVPYITNLRGFNYNKLFGNNYILWNIEFRLPLLKYFYKSSITSNFFRNLQLVAFADAGAAWTGLSPFKRENALNTFEGQEGPFTYQVSTFKNPFLAGTGFGARTIILGYYVKLDVAWSIEDKAVNPIGSPQYYLSLGYDF